MTKVKKKALLRKNILLMIIITGNLNIQNHQSDETNSIMNKKTLKQIQVANKNMFYNIRLFPGK